MKGELLKNMQVALVTGATGYIGRNLVSKLALRGWRVCVLCRTDSDLKALTANLRSGDIFYYDGTRESVIKCLVQVKPSVVFHLASLFLVTHNGGDIDSLLEANISFGAKLVDACVETGVTKFINTSSSWQHFADEKYNPMNLYAASKQAFEDILEYYVKAYELDVVTLVLFDTYGPCDTRGKIVSLLWRAAMQNDDVNMSPGEQLIDLVYVDDVTEAFLQASKLDLSSCTLTRRFGVSSGAPITIRRLALVFQEVIGRPLNLKWGGRPYRAREVMIPWGNFYSLPNWTPVISLIQGIEKSRPT